MLLDDDDCDSDQNTQTYDENGVTISWDNLTIRANSKRDNSYVKNLFRKIIFRIAPVYNSTYKILDSVTGHANSGSLVAIMGPSGAGKTTLLAALAKRIDLSSGCVQINGCNVSKNQMSAIAGYLPQSDALPSALTAMEYMLFTCALRLDKKTSPKERHTLAADIFTQLGLFESRDTVISKLSGGETKRLSLAVELVTKPKILFLDEPTSGLDTWTAMRVIESLKAEARNGTLVFCSIHQPAMDIYQMFSHVILLANGKTAYYGALKNARKFFNSEGFHCPDSFNEAEYYVKVISNENYDDPPNSFLVSGYSSKICNSFSKSTYNSKLSKSRRSVNHKFEIKSDTRKPNQFVQFYWLTWRIFLDMRRTMFRDMTDTYTFFLSMILVGMFYYGVNSRTQSGIQDIRGVLYMISAEVIFSSAYSVIYVIPSEMPLYLRENSMYNPAAYYIATVIGLIPKTVFHGLAYISMMFLTLDLDVDIVIFIEFAFCVIVATIASSAYGILVSSWIESPEFAAIAMAPVDLISFLMAGIFYNLRSMPSYVSWLRYLSIFYYTNEALAIIFWTTVDSIECYSDKNLPCFKNGREVLAGYGYNEFNLWLDGCGLGLLILILHILGYLGVRRRRVKKSIY